MSRKEDRLLKKMEDDTHKYEFPKTVNQRERNYLGEYDIPLPQRVPWNKYFEFSCDGESPYHVDQGGVGYCWMVSVMLLLLNLKIPLNSRAKHFLYLLEKRFNSGAMKDFCPMIPSWLLYWWKQSVHIRGYKAAHTGNVPAFEDSHGFSTVGFQGLAQERHGGDDVSTYRRRSTAGLSGARPEEGAKLSELLPFLHAILIGGGCNVGFRGTQKWYARGAWTKEKAQPRPQCDVPGCHDKAVALGPGDVSVHGNLQRGVPPTHSGPAMAWWFRNHTPVESCITDFEARKVFRDLVKVWLTKCKKHTLEHVYVPDDALELADIPSGRNLVENIDVLKDSPPLVKGTAAIQLRKPAQSLSEWLAGVRLAAPAQRAVARMLADFGATVVADLEDLEDEDMAGLGLKKFELLRLKRAVNDPALSSAPHKNLDVYKKSVRFGDNHAKVIKFIHLTINSEKPTLFQIAKVMRDAAARIDGLRPLRGEREVWHVGLKDYQAAEFMAQVKDAAWAASHSDAEKIRATTAALAQLAGDQHLIAASIPRALGGKLGRRILDLIAKERKDTWKAGLDNNQLRVGGDTLLFAMPAAEKKLLYDIKIQLEKAGVLAARGKCQLTPELGPVEAETDIKYKSYWKWGMGKKRFFHDIATLKEGRWAWARQEALRRRDPPLPLATQEAHLKVGPLDAEGTAVRADVLRRRLAAIEPPPTIFLIHYSGVDQLSGSDLFKTNIAVAGSALNYDYTSRATPRVRRESFAPMMLEIDRNPWGAGGGISLDDFIKHFKDAPEKVKGGVLVAGWRAQRSQIDGKPHRFGRGVLGGVLPTPAAGMHAVPFFCCNGQITYCNSWGKPCADIRDILQELRPPSMVGKHPYIKDVCVLIMESKYASPPLLAEAGSAAAAIRKRRQEKRGRDLGTEVGTDEFSKAALLRGQSAARARDRAQKGFVERMRRDGIPDPDDAQWLFRRRQVGLVPTQLPTAAKPSPTREQQRSGASTWRRWEAGDLFPGSAGGHRNRRTSSKKKKPRQTRKRRKRRKSTKKRRSRRKSTKKRRKKRH